jgi:hypothetical protein
VAGAAVPAGSLVALDRAPLPVGEGCTCAVEPAVAVAVVEGSGGVIDGGAERVLEGGGAVVDAGAVVLAEGATSGSERRRARSMKKYTTIASSAANRKMKINAARR